MGNLVTVIVAVLSSSAFFAFLQFLVQRKDSKNETEKGINENLNNISVHIEEILGKIHEIEKHNEGQDEALLLMARNILQSECSDTIYRLTNDKKVSEEKIHDILEGYYIYHKRLKGNSYTTSRCRTVYNLYNRTNLTNEEFVKMVEEFFENGR